MCSLSSKMAWKCSRPRGVNRPMDAIMSATERAVKAPREKPIKMMSSPGT